MDSKYSNIFWHEGVKIFEEKLLEKPEGRIRIQHLENDVTKSLLNLFQHSNKQVLRTFLQLIDIIESPEGFEFDFQITDKFKYHKKNKRIMLSIISDYTKEISHTSYSGEMSRPDACIFSEDTAILIESKTQSPLISQQVQCHIKNYLGSATEKTITWETMSERFRNASHTLSPLDKFLVTQFCDFLELIGIAAFSGFTLTDFSMLSSIETISKEDYLDFKRMFHRKIERFMERLFDDDVKTILNFKKNGIKIEKVDPTSRVMWSAIYFYDDDPNIHVNEYPNINFLFTEHGMELALNGEIRSSFNRILKHIANAPEEFERIAHKMAGFDFSLFYKLHYRPQDNFLWGYINKGYPKSMGLISSRKVLSDKDNFENHWSGVKDKLINEMKLGKKKHTSGRLFNVKETNFAETRNPRSHFVIRIEKKFPTSDIARMGNNTLIEYFKNEVIRLRECVEFILS